MEDHSAVIGNRIQKICAICGESRGHIVVSVSKTGNISSVKCPQCDTRSRYKKSDNLKAIEAAEGALYNMGVTYRKGQVLMHPTFGAGEVTAVVDQGKIDVLFSDRVRRLIHTRI